MDNRILSRLSVADFHLLEPHLDPVDLPLRKPLESRNKKITSVYFPESGFASVVANGAGQQSIEVGLIGREGMTGVSVVLGHERALHETYMQAAGHGQCISVANLEQAIEKSVTLHRVMLRYARSFLAQTAQKRPSPTVEIRLKNAWRAGCYWHVTG